MASAMQAQINVTTFHYDNARTGQNTQETVLTPSNVNSGQFGKLFSVPLDGYVYAQPLYMANLGINGGTHNVLYVATEHDSLNAIDADSGQVYWQLSRINPSNGITTVSSSDVACGSLVPEIGITSTPVIDPSTGTIYFVALTKENGSFFQRLHAIDLVTHTEKFNGPVVISAEVNGTGEGSSGQTVSFNPLTQNNRAALLLENGHIVIAWASYCDNGPYQGWVMSYNAYTLLQEAAINMAPNGSDAGVWMSGDGVAADGNGYFYFATGNGTYDGTLNQDYGDSVVRLGLPNAGMFPVLDWFTPFNQNSLSLGDIDLGSGGVLLLPDLPNDSPHRHLLVAMGKEGIIYLVDRDNMGHYCSTCTSQDTNVVQEIPGASGGILGSPAYWNGNIYWGEGLSSSSVEQFSFNADDSGMVSTYPISTTPLMNASMAAPVISANGTSSGILWALDNSSNTSACCQVLYAFDATNLSNVLYNSNQAGSRDVPGGAVKFTSPVVANGKVFVGSQYQVSTFGIISSMPVVAIPSFNPAPGSYTAAVNVALSDSTPGAIVHCTTDGSTPSTQSPVCTTTVISGSMTIKAIGVAAGYSNSAIATGTYNIDAGASGINYGAGFTSLTGLTFNGSASNSGTRLRLTGLVNNTAGSVFMNTPVNVQTFTNDFTFQLSEAQGEGFTFTIQGVGPTALGQSAGGLGYGPSAIGGSGGIGNSIAVKFDLFNDNGEGNNSTGMYTDGASPIIPAIDMTSSGVNLHGGNTYSVHMTYDGTTLMMTITDVNDPSVSFSANWPINIPSTIDSNTAYIGFTGSTGKRDAIQEIITWTFVSSLPIGTGPTSTTLSSNLNPSYLNQPVTFTATVSSQNGPTPSGSITFKNGANAMATVPLSGGTAAFAKIFPSAGNRFITAVYSGDVNNVGSASPALSQVVNALPAATVAELTTSVIPSFVGQQITFTATISSTYGPVPDGELVTFKDATTTPAIVLGSAALSGGVAVFTTTSLGNGTRSIKAKYTGDATFASSLATVTQVVQRYPTTTTLASNLNPSYFGQTVVLTAQVTGTGPGVPTGTITFYSGTTALGTAPLNSSGTAQLSTATLPSGTNVLSADYNRDATNAVSVSSNFSEVVNQAIVTMTLSSTPNPSVAGQSVQLSAKLSSTGSMPASSVTFAYGTTTLGTASIVNGVAVLSTTSLPKGTDQVTASYAGNANHTPATASINQQIQ